MEHSKATSTSKSANQESQELDKTKGSHSPVWASEYTLTWTADQLCLSLSKSTLWTVKGIKTTPTGENITLPAECSAEIVKMKKSDGLSVWITYHKTVGWIFKVADHCKAFRDQEDAHQKFVPKHEADGFTYPVAKLWFKILGKLTQVESKRLHEELEQKTLIGEYTGHPERSNLIKYGTPEIFFYAMTIHAKPGVIVPPSSFFAFCEDFQFDYAEYDTRDKIKTDTTLNKTVADIERDAQIAPIAEAEQGFFLFIVLAKGKLEKVQQIRFVDNLEYTVYEKLRASLISGSSELIGQTIFETQVEEVYKLGGERLPQPVKFYTYLAKVCQKYAKSQKWIAELAEVDFGAFILKVLDVVINRTKLSKAPLSKQMLASLPNHQRELYSPGNQDQILEKLRSEAQSEPQTPTEEPSQKARITPPEAEPHQVSQVFAPTVPVVTTSSCQPLPQTTHHQTASTTQTQPSTVAPGSHSRAHPTTTTTTSSPVQPPHSPVTQPPTPQTQTQTQTPTAVPPLPQPLPLHTRTLVLLPVLPPSAGLSTYTRTLTDRLQQLTLSRVFDRSVAVVSVSWDDCVARAAVQVGGLQNRLSAEGEKQLLGVTAMQAVVRGVFEGVAGKESGERVVVLVDKAFTLEGAKAFIEGFRGSVAKGSTYDPYFLCLAASGAGGSEPRILKDLGFGATAVATMIDRKLQGISDPSTALGATDSVLNTLQMMRGVPPNTQTVKGFGFDGFIGFPFFNVDWEEEVPTRAEYDLFFSTLHYLLRAADPDDPSKSQKLQTLSQLAPKLVQKLQNWWELDDPEQPGTKIYEVFVAKSISSIYKKFESIKETVPEQPPTADQKLVHTNQQPPTIQPFTEVQAPAPQPQISEEQRLAQILRPQIAQKLIPNALEAMAFARAYDTLAERDSIALKSALLDKPSSWKLSEPRVVGPKLPTGSAELEIVAFAYLPACTVLALPKQPVGKPSCLRFAESSTSQLSQDEIVALIGKLNKEAALSLDRAGPVEELTALRVDGRLVFIMAGACALSLTN